MPIRAVGAILPVALATLSSLAAGAEIPRTPSGRPDFTGTYDIATLTPYERDPQHGDKLYLDAELARRIEEAAAARMAQANAPSDPERGAPAKGANVDRRSYDAFWLDPGTTRFAIDGTHRTSILFDPPNGRLPALSEAGEKRRALLRPRAYRNTGTAWWLETGEDPYDDPDGMSLLDRCLYLGAVTVPIRPVVYNNLKTIVQTDTHVVILIEWMHWARVIRLDSRHLPSDLRSLAGDSIGWWEGDTLVVETTNFLERPGVPREGLRALERFTPIDGNTLRYGFTVHDPDHAAPYSGELPWPKTSARSYEYACHEGNYSLANTLRGARQLEREWYELHGAAEAAPESPKATN